MFTNVGREIKLKAERIVFGRTLLWAIVTLLPVVVIGMWAGDETVTVILIIVWAILLAIAYFSFRDKAMVLYAQGELTENVMIIKSILSERPKNTYKAEEKIVINPVLSGNETTVEKKIASPVPIQSNINSWKCTGCGSDNVNTARFCSKCGKLKGVLGETEEKSYFWTCPRCGIKNLPSSKFCSQCRTQRNI